LHVTRKCRMIFHFFSEKKSDYFKSPRSKGLFTFTTIQRTHTFNTLRSSSIIVISEVENAREGPPLSNTQT